MYTRDRLSCSFEQNLLYLNHAVIRGDAVRLSNYWNIANGKQKKLLSVLRRRTCSPTIIASVNKNEKVDQREVEKLFAECPDLMEISFHEVGKCSTLCKVRRVDGEIVWI